MKIFNQKFAMLEIIRIQKSIIRKRKLKALVARIYEIHFMFYRQNWKSIFRIHKNTFVELVQTFLENIWSNRKDYNFNAD